MSRSQDRFPAARRRRSHRTPAKSGYRPPHADPSLTELLGGRRGAIDATLPPVAYVVGWFASGESIQVGIIAAISVAAVVALWRLRAGARPLAVAVGLLAVCVAALIALRTGRAADFFLLQVLSNAASALVWAVSIVVRWPLLGVVVGVVLGQRTSWRRDSALLRAYTHASWIWACQYLVRLLVFVPLWAGGYVVVLGAARVALSWPLIALTLAVSWFVLRRSLPDDHPGVRRPLVPERT